MADNVDNHSGQRIERRRLDRLYANRNREQRTAPRSKDKVEESQLPVPPPDPWTHDNAWCAQNPRQQTKTTQSRSLDEDEDIIAYLTDFGTPTVESQTSECPSRNSATSAMAVSANLYAEDAFEHLDRLYAFAEQILELRSRSSKYFRRVRNLEKLKVLRNANRRLENAFAGDKDSIADVCEEDTGFAESLLDAMLSNGRDPSFQRRYARSSSSRQTRGKAELGKQTSTDEMSANAPKVSKWTRVKAAFKWERACTNDAAETMDTPSTTTTTILPSSTAKYHRSPDIETGESNSIHVSSYANEACDVGTPLGRASSASSSNEGSYDCTQKNVSHHLACQSLKVKANKKVECTNQRSQSLDNDVVALNIVGDINLINTGKPLIRVTSEKSYTAHSSNRTDERDTNLSTKRSTPTLTITIPSNEDEMRCMSSPDSSSPLPSSAHTSGGNSPQHRKIHREFSINKDFKRQQSVSDEFAQLRPKTQRQNSKWNKVRRAFLTNSTLSVPPNLIRVVSRQMLLQDGLESSLAYSCSESTEDLRKSASNAQSETRRDYKALREKLGAEFHRKLVEWERLKNLSPRIAAKDTREIPCNMLNPRETLLSEERLAPEFRKKLQDWKRTKKERRGSAPLEQQRINRRRLTDWQLWRTPSKSEYRGKDALGPRGSCEESVVEGKSHLGEDFVRKMEIWKRTNDTCNRDVKRTIESKSNRLGISSGIDESEFLALERVVPLFDNGIGRGRRESDARQLDECFDGDTRLYVDGTQNANDTNEVLIRTSVGSYRFEGISREFTRKLYDWERYRGISPTSSTFRLLGPAYDPFARNTNIETSPVETPTKKDRNDESSLFKVNALKRSKSAGSVIEKMIQDEFFIRRSASLQTLSRLANRLKDNERIDTLPTSIDSRRTEDIAEDIVMDDSEPEAMIVDIEDVIEETASPLERVQPHQTPVYSVAASETTSIAVPLGTVTSSHEPSPVFLIEIEENEDRKRWESKKWSRRKSFSSEDSFSTERFETTRTWSNRKKKEPKDDSVDSDHGSVTEASNEKIRRRGNNDEKFDRDLDKDSVKSDSSIYSVEVDCKYRVTKQSKERIERNHTDCERDDISITSSNDGSAIGIATKDRGPGGTDENESVYVRKHGNHFAFAASFREMMDLSSVKKHEQDDNRVPENDGSNGNDKIVTDQANVKCDNEYEEIEPSPVDRRRCLLADTRTNYSEELAKPLSGSPTKCRLEAAKFTLSEMGLRRINRDEERFNEHEKNYGVIREEIHSRHVYHELSKIKSNLREREPPKSNNEIANLEQRNGHSRGISTIVESTESRGRQYRNLENVLTSLTLRAINPCNGEYHREPTIRTTPCTVASCREERCFERIIINEETLNKIVVPTASTGCTDKSNESTKVNETETSSMEPEATNDRETSVKKRVSGSPGRSVFVKTKRMIFSPFRRLDEHSASRKESLDDDHALPTKGKSKSRSASPKISRQDVLSRMSLSLPWPLRPSSKDRELRETKIKGSEKEERTNVEKPTVERCGSTESGRKSSIGEKGVTQAQVLNDSNSSLELSENGKEQRRSSGERSKRVSVSVQATPDQQQVQTVHGIGAYSSRSDERKSDTCSLKFDPNSSDLVHKLKVLSNAVARRDGRTNTISEDTSVESHSLRIRRAKEDFLSRRGGPLCHSVLEPRSFKDYQFPKANAYRCGDIAENRAKEDEKSLDTNRALTLEEVPIAHETREEITTERNVEIFRNQCDGSQLSDSSIVSRPDRVKSASVGMINIDPDTFERLTETNRGCESLPRTIVKQQEPLGPIAKFVNKLKFGKLIRGNDIEEGNMSTISKLCRQSLLIDVRNDSERSWVAGDRKETSTNITRQTEE